MEEGGCWLNWFISTITHGILHIGKKEGSPTLCSSMDGTGEYYAKRNKLGSERQIPYDLTYKWNLMNKNKLTSKIEPEA